MRVTTFVIRFGFYYMLSSPSQVRFYGLLTLFVVSIILFVTSDRPWVIFIGWDGLGVVSYFLVMAYGRPYASTSAKVTIIRNRFGDLFLITGLGTLIGLSWDSSLEQSPSLFIEAGSWLMLTALTKRAQFPFSCWLPEAMAAPTPVSSLVHSSTLVTAGFFILLIFYQLFSRSGLCSIIIIRGVTVLLAGGISLQYKDLKKVVAFRTLSQISFMCFILRLGHPSVGLFHLLSHALFKSSLFIAVGCIMAVRLGGQDFRAIRRVSTRSIIRLILNVSLLGLIGGP